MRVADLMQLDLVTVAPEATVAEAETLLAVNHLTALPVVDGDGRLLGVLSASDLVAADVECDEASQLATLHAGTQVHAVMTPRPFTVGPEAGVREAARLMLYTGVHRLYVTRDDRPLGVISTSDVVRGVALGRI